MTDPTELTVSELEAHVADVDDADELATLREAEKAGDDRVTALEAIDERLDEVGEAESDEDAAEALSEAKEELSGMDAKEAAENSGEAYVTVKNPEGRGGHIAGFGFEPHEAKRVKNSPRVRTALRNGKLQFVSNR